MSFATAGRPIRQQLTDAEWCTSATTTTLPPRAALSGDLRLDQTIKGPPPAGDFLIMSQGTPPDWARPTFEGLRRLLSLPPNWDTYGAPPVDVRYVASALSLVLETFLDTTPPPSVVPTSRGGLQLEWHSRGTDLEIEFTSPSRLRLFKEDLRTGKSIEVELTRDFAPLADAIATISKQP